MGQQQVYIHKTYTGYVFKLSQRNGDKLWEVQKLYDIKGKIWIIEFMHACTFLRKLISKERRKLKTNLTLTFNN